MTEKTNHLLIEILNELRSLSQYGNNSVVRRIQSHIEDRILSDDTAKCEFNRMGIKPRCDVVIRTEDAIEEVSAEDRRRNVFLGVEENYIANMTDLYLGRLHTVEFRDLEDLDLSKFDDRLKEIAKKKIPAVSINEKLYDKQEIITSLQTMLAALTSSDETAGTIETRSNQICEKIGTTTADNPNYQWFDNGKRLTYTVLDVYECKEGDPCCKNKIFTIKNNPHIKEWNDGNLGKPPPILPPDFNAVRWDNSIPLFRGPTNFFLTSDYGWRRLPDQQNPDFHSGIDINAPAGTEVITPVSGEVIAAINSGYNSFIYVRDSQGVIHNFYHVSPTLKAGDSVSVGDVVGKVASGGNDHLHYARHRGVPVSDQNSIPTP